jgi:hypothetical protein
VALQVGDIGARDLHGAQRLQAQQAEQRAIAQVPEFVIVWDCAEQQGQFDLREITEILGRATIARRAHAGAGLSARKPAAAAAAHTRRSMFSLWAMVLA